MQFFYEVFSESCVFLQKKMRFKKIKRKINKIRRKRGKISVPVLKQFTKGERLINFSHIAAFLLPNAGDVLLPIALKDLFQCETGRINWTNIHVHKVLNDKMLQQINATQGLLIGGGGLFLKDSNPNVISGWQWPCPLDMLKRINVPMALFAVGYNRFPGQADFDDIFYEHVKLVAEKSVYIGLRNHGSIEALKNYLPENLHTKLRFQPCMTTLISKIYPELYSYKSKEKFIALNCAFDRAELRFGTQTEHILSSIARAVKRLADRYPLKYYAHTLNDLKMIPYLKAEGLNYTLVDLNERHPKKILEAYARPSLVIGMRGHAQMIPFGCLSPVLSLISHDKMQWFLNDIHHPEWGIDVKSDRLEEELLDKSLYMLQNQMEIICEIEKQQEELWRISIKNVQDFYAVSL